jgi:TonB-dependent receptor
LLKTIKAKSKFMLPKRLKQPLRRLFILTTLVFALLPGIALAQDARYSIQFEAGSLEQAIIKLRKATGSSIAYTKEELQGLSVPASVHNNKTVEQILHELVARNGFVIEKKGIAWFVKKGNDRSLPSPVPKKEPGRIMGILLDEETGQPVSDVTIRIGNKGTTTATDGSFSITLLPGKYEAEISSIGFGKKIVSDIVLNENASLELNITLKREKNTLEGVTVRSSVRRESIAALYTRQKNEAGISNGISREQISALPDKNIGETLKRISGVSTTDNRRVVVRGIAERYNLAMMDGATLPSTDVQVRDFEFDIIPSNMVDNVIVSKTATPDMSFGFGGGLVQINTMGIPNNNFTTFSAGTKYTKGSTGKDFLGYGRGKNDYLGFDDGGRKHFPKDMIIFTGLNYKPTDPYSYQPPPGVEKTTVEMIAAQNKRIGGTERLGTRVYSAAPGQNYQFSLGRSYNIGKDRIGFVGSLSYRNEQTIDDITGFERGEFNKMNGNRYDVKTGEEIDVNQARQYNFTTTWGALFNFGWSSKNHKIIARNFYSRVFANQFFRVVGWGADLGFGVDPAIREYDRPKFIDLLQNRISAEHSVGKFKIDWSVARNKVTNHEQDATEAWLAPMTTVNGKLYNYAPGGTTQPGVGNLNRSEYKYEESNWMADAALSYKVNIGKLDQVIKAGYQFLEKKGNYHWNILPIGVTSGIGSTVIHRPIQQWSMDFKDPLNDPYYYPADFSNNNYSGKNNNQAFFAMMDNRFTSWLRLVWGFRAEYYKYEKIKDAAAERAALNVIADLDKQKYVDPETGKLVHRTIDASSEEKRWQHLPSASLTITPLKNFNIRASYAKSAIRPSLIENSSFARFNYLYGRLQRNTGVMSTIITHYDFRMEWYPGAGEVISAGYFRKHFKDPVEMYMDVTTTNGQIELLTANSDYADVDGLEFDLRKNLGFISKNVNFLKELWFSSNLTLQRSEVQASGFNYGTLGAGDDHNGVNYSYRYKTRLKEKRPLYGQVPILYNIGLQYTGDRLGANIALNHSGYKTLTVGMLPQYSEYERPRNQLDAQLSYKLTKNKKIEAKLNMSNLLNSPYRFFINSNETYKVKPGGNFMTMREWSEVYEWKYGFSDKYEEGYYETDAEGKTKRRIGDINTFTRKVGSSFSLTVSYNL